MADPDRVERFWPARLRWRMRGAWLWPVFLVLTPLEGILLALLPPWNGEPTVIGGTLLAGFANLFLIAAVAPLAARLVRRHRPWLPRMIAVDQAGTGLLCLLLAVLFIGGLAHRPAAAAREQDLDAAYAAARRYVQRQAPEFRAGLAGVDALRLAEHAYRICVPGGDSRMCLYVDTDRVPPGVRRDTSTEPNSDLRTVGGFR